MDRLPEQRISEPIATSGGLVGRLGRTTMVRVGDKWADKDGDLWFAVATDDGPRLQLCGLDNSPPPSYTAKRTPEYVNDEYGPLVLRWRAGREVLDVVRLRGRSE